MDRNRGLDINALRQQLEDLFEDFFPSAGARRPGGGRPEQAQHLPVNLVESDDQFVLTAPLPGLLPEDIEITVRGQNLNLRAQRKHMPSERPNFVRREWSFGPYQRNLELPALVDAEHASAAFRQGVVTITIPKADTSRSRTVLVDEPETAEEQAAGETETITVPTTEGVEPADEATSAEAQSAEAKETTDDRAGGHSFYMRPPQGNRRGGGRNQQNQGPRPDRSASAVTPDMESTVAEQVREESEIEAQAQPNAPATAEPLPETTPEIPFDVASPLDAGSMTSEPNPMAEPEEAAQSSVGADPERPQETGVEDVSPVAHTTTASDTAQDLGEQRGPSTSSEPYSDAGTSIPIDSSATDQEEAADNQTRNEPND